MDQLIRKLQKFTVQLEENRNKIFVLENGQDITELIKACTSHYDILTLANKIRDQLVDVDADDHIELNGLSKSFAERNAAGYVDRHGNEEEQGNFDEDEEEDHSIAKSIIEKYHAGILNEESQIFAEDDDEEDSFGEEITSILTDLMIDGNWNDWGECLGSLKYSYPKILDELYFDSPYDIADIIDYNDENTTDPEKIAYIRRFYSGELTEGEIVILVTSIIQYCHENQGAEDYYVEMEGEFEEEIDEDLSSHYSMVKFECNLLESAEDKFRLRKRLKLLKEGEESYYDTLCEIGDEIDALHEIEEDKMYDEHDEPKGTFSEKRKRHRVKFDLKDDPLPEIRFEQQQTDFILDKYSMEMLIREIAQDHGKDIDFTPEAIEAIHTDLEAHMIELFQDANLVAVNGELTHIAPKHIQTARRISKSDDYD